MSDSEQTQSKTEETSDAKVEPDVVLEPVCVLETQDSWIGDVDGTTRCDETIYTIICTPDLHLDGDSDDGEYYEFGDTNSMQRRTVKSCLCHICHKMYSTPKSLRRHLITSHQIPKKPTVSSHRPFRCPKCLDTPCAATRTFVCCVCNKKYAGAKYVRKHMRNIHSGKRRDRSCPHCGKILTTEYGMILHIRAIHEGERPFHCKTCGKDFVTASSLHVHTRIHTGEKPYVCEDCGKNFSDKSNLRHHIKVHR